MALNNLTVTKIDSQQPTYQPTQPQGQGLAGFLGSIGNSIGNVGRSIVGVIGTGIASGRDLLGELTGGDNINSKKYVEGKETDAFKKWLYGTDEKGKANYAKAAGQALDAAATVSNLIPGANTLAGNAIQGAVGGFGQTFADTNGDLNAAINSAGTGAITGAVTTKANQALNNVIAKNAGNKLVNNALVNNAVTRGAVSGAVGGATGGFTGTLLNGGSIQEAVGNAVKGTGQGAVQGGISGGAMALGNKVLSKVPGVNGVVEATNEMQNDFEKQRQEKQLARLAEKQAKKAQTTAQQVTADDGTPDYTKPLGYNGEEVDSSQRSALEKVSKALKTTGDRIKNKQVYGALDSKLANKVVENDSVNKLKQLGYTTDDYDRAAKVSETTNKFIDDVIENSDATYVDPEFTNRIYDLEKAGITTTNVIDSNSIKRKVRTQLDKSVANATSGNPNIMDEFSASKALAESRKLGKLASQAYNMGYDANGKVKNSDWAAAYEVYDNAKKQFRSVAEAATDGGFTDNYSMGQLAARLKNSGANEKTIDYITKNVDSLGDLIGRTSLFMDAKDMNKAIGRTQLRRDAQSTGRINSANPWEVVNKSGLLDTLDLVAKPVSSALGTAVEKAGDLVGAVSNATTNNNISGDITAPVAVTTNNTSLPTNAYDFIGTREGINQVSNIAQGNNLANTLSNITPTANAQTVAQTTSPLGQGVGTTTATLANTGTPTTATQSPLDIISTAMTLALQAGDLDSMTKLMSLYNSASQIYGGGSNSSSQKLSTTQQKANAAMTQLQSLANMQPSTAYSLSGIPVIGDIARIGGDAYSEASDGLALQLGYLLSGATIKDEELARIKRDYVPQPWDSDETRQRKLQAAAALISQYQNGYMTSPE